MGVTLRVSIMKLVRGERVLRSRVSGRRVFYYVVDDALKKLVLRAWFDFKELTCE